MTILTTKEHLPVGGARRRSREFALLGVYQSIIDPDVDFAAIQAGLLDVLTDESEGALACELTSEDFKSCDQAFYRAILTGVLSERDALMELLAKHVDRDPARLSVIERACLMIGAWELKHCPENPYRVIINEAVELSKQFGADKGYRLVNGVLDKVACEVRPEEFASQHAS